MPDEPDKPAPAPPPETKPAEDDPIVIPPPIGSEELPTSPRRSGRPDEDPLLGQVINERVKLVSVIARGGMGKVYKGEQVGLGRACAVKILDPKAASAENEEDFAKRFLLEASVTSKLTHPNAVTIFDYGETKDGVCYIAMEYLEGQTLAEELKRNGRLPPERAVRITQQVCRALREAHAMGVVHRDLKPGNIFLVKRDGEEDDFVKVLDFGLVKETTHADTQHTKVGQFMGSPRYMAPEQIQGKAVDARTDIYSLGAVLFAMIAGRPPFDRPNEMATMMAHVSEPAPPLSQVAADVAVPAAIEGIVMRCLAKDPGERFASMEELLAALKLQGGTAYSTASGQQSVAAYVSSTGSGSGTHRGVDVATAGTPQKKSVSPVWFVLAAAAAAVALVLFLTRGSQEHTDGSAPSARPSASARRDVPAASASGVREAASAVPAARSTAPAAPLFTAVITIDTDPPGARVKEDGNVKCHPTPCDITYRGNDADASVEHLLEVTLDGYQREKVTVHADGKPFPKLTMKRK